MRELPAKGWQSSPAPRNPQNDVLSSLIRVLQAQNKATEIDQSFRQSIAAQKTVMGHAARQREAALLAEWARLLQTQNKRVLARAA